ncbi:hypothetical protein CTH_0507 [Carboxydocella thermautotrophica]|nr:hypothetical protein CTH_0507 [Carboxydocella thermautotrophica]
MSKQSNYCPNEFRVQVYGTSTSQPLKTNNQGQLIIKKIIEPMNVIQVPVFVSQKLQGVQVTGIPQKWLQQDVATLREYSYLLHNVGSVTVVATLLIAPESTGPWVTDGLAQVLEPEKAKVMNPNFFLRYLAVELVKIDNQGPDGIVDIYFQGHS